MSKEKIIINFDNMSDGDKVFLQKANFEKVKSILENNQKKDENHHNTNNIFINGKRGEGKTHFLNNLKNYIDKDNKEIYFFEPLDPSLLHDNENFLTIVLANVLNELQDEEKNKMKDKDKKKFYDLLNDIASAIDGIIVNNNKTKTTLQTISQDQTSLKLSKLLNSFFKKAIKLLEVKHLVFLIDDVDMALGKGFEVLDTIRKYLESQYITTIITGDMKQYKILVKNKFSEYLYGGKKDDSDELKVSQKLAKNYLIKVFPQQDRIKIHRISYFIKDEEVNIVFIINGKEIELEKFNQKFEDFTNVFFSNKIRNIVQFSLGEIKNGEISGISWKNIQSKYSLKFLIDYDLIRKYIYDNKSQEALDFIEKYIKKDIITDELYFHQGLSYGELKDYENEIKSYKKSAEINPKRDMTYYNMGIAYGDLKDYDNAIKSYKKSVEINPKKSEAYSNMGMAYGELKDYDNAIKSYKKSVEINPKRDGAYHNMGIDYSTLKDYANAIKSHQKAIDINPLKAYKDALKIATANAKKPPK